MHGGIQVCPIEPTRLLVKELREAGKTNIDMVEWEQVHSICSDLFENIANKVQPPQPALVHFLA